MEKQTLLPIFYSRMQMDLNLILQIKLEDDVRILQIDIKKEAKPPNVFLSNFTEIELFFANIQTVVDEQFITPLEAHGPYNQHLAKQPIDDPDVITAGFFMFASIPLVNFNKTNNFEDILNVLPNSAQPRDMAKNDKMMKLSER